MAKRAREHLQKEATLARAYHKFACPGALPEKLDTLLFIEGKQPQMRQARLPGTDAKCKCDLPVRDATMCACVALWRSGVASGTHAQATFPHALMPCSYHDPSGPPMEHHHGAAGAPKKRRGPVDKLWHGILKACSRY